MCNGANCTHKTRPMARGLMLRTPLGPDYLAEPEDILDAKRALIDLGYYQPLGGEKPGAWVDNDLFAGIKRFQRDHGLKVDGLMRPGGPTEDAINTALEDDQPASPANDDQPPANDDAPDVALLDCDTLLGRDSFRCGRLATKQLTAICMSSAMSRYGNCLANRPLGPLTTKV